MLCIWALGDKLGLVRMDVCCRVVGNILEMDWSVVLEMGWYGLMF